MTKEDFVKDSQGYGSHRPLLWEALQATKESIHPIIELGCGYESTPFLLKYSNESERVLFSYDSNKKWAALFDGTEYVPDWERNPLWLHPYSVCLLDLAPGEYRRVALMKIRADIIVLHDSETPGWNASDYRVRPLFSKFKYMIDDIPKEKGAPWTTALSNTIDVTKFQL